MARGSAGTPKNPRVPADRIATRGSCSGGHRCRSKLQPWTATDIAGADKKRSGTPLLLELVSAGRNAKFGTAQWFGTASSGERHQPVADSRQLPRDWFFTLTLRATLFILRNFSHLPMVFCCFGLPRARTGKDGQIKDKPQIPIRS